MARHDNRRGSISIHAPRTGSDPKERKPTAFDLISIHAPRTGSDVFPAYPFKKFCVFQSTLPARGATRRGENASESTDDFNPRSPHGERQALPPMLREALEISIHAPRTGSDRAAAPTEKQRALISIHAPRTGSDSAPRGSSCSAWVFQSTLPARGATRRSRRWMAAAHFNPRSPHGERPTATVVDADTAAISIHAPRTGSDLARAKPGADAGYFNPRSPHGERPGGDPFFYDSWDISIHAPRTGSDAMVRCSGSAYFYFNPRSPHGERQLPSGWRNSPYNISIHAPRTGSDENLLHTVRDYIISIHAPRTGSDIVNKIIGRGIRDFNPRSPHGERRRPVLRFHPPRHFNPRSPHGERPVLRAFAADTQTISIHAPRTGSDAELNNK